MSRRVIVGFSGASGVVYGLRLVNVLCDLRVSGLIDRLYIVYTGNAVKVAHYEINIDLLDILSGRKCIDGLYSDYDWDSPLASSSSTIGYSMAIIPCSMDVVANLAHGIQHRLLERVAYNVMRVGGKIVLVIRETPLTQIDLENLLKLSRSGVVILPASPAFYIKPKSINDLIDFIVGKTLDILGIEHKLYRRWRGPA